MNEQESLLLDVGNMAGVIAIVITLFAIATVGAVLFEQIRK